MEFTGTRNKAGWTTWRLATAEDSDTWNADQREGEGATLQAEPLSGVVLLVEDDPADRLLFRHVLEQIGFDHGAILSTSNAEEAMSEALACGPQFVVCDWLLGAQHARGLLRDLRSACPDAAMVVVSGDVTQTREALALEAGAQDILPKDKTSPAGLHRALWRARERVNAARRERDLAVQIARANRLQQMGTLAVGAVHDLGNMLAAAMMNFDLLDESDASEEGEGVDRQAIERDIRLSIERASQMCRALMAFGRSGPRGPQVVDLEGLVGECVRLLPRRTRSAVTVRIDEPHDGSRVPSALVEPSAVEQVLYNLLLNAGDALDDDGTIQVLVTTSGPATADDDHVIVAPPPGVPMLKLVVQDDGSGIPPGDLRRVFRPFVSTKRGSRGLGLPSVVRAIRGLGGALSVRSNRGGTRFTVGLPIAKSGEEGGETLAATTVVPATAAPEDAASVIVVLDPRAPSSLVDRLRKEGHRVEWSRSVDAYLRLVSDLSGRLVACVVRSSNARLDFEELISELWLAAPDVPVHVLDDDDAGVGLASTPLARVHVELEALIGAIARAAPRLRLH